MRRADPSSRGVLPLCVIRCNINTVHLQWLGGKGQNKKERSFFRIGVNFRENESWSTKFNKIPIISFRIKCFSICRDAMGIEKNVMGWSCGTYGGRERCAQGFGGET